MKTLTLFNHKGGVGKTTLTVNLAHSFAKAGKRVLLVDTDPQCNLSAFYLPEEQLDELLGETELARTETHTVWSALEPARRSPPRAPCHRRGRDVAQEVHRPSTFGMRSPILSKVGTQEF